MGFFITRIRGLFRSARPVPPELRRNFFHLYLDIAWMGVVSGTTMSFLGVYATRLGATSQQLGLLSALPALVTLMISLPVGSWLGRRPVGKAVFWAAAIQRLFYLIFIPLPVLFAAPAQIWLIIAITLVMTVPGTALTVGFNALFAEAVPADWRGQVYGVRNALVALVSTAFTWLAGWMLDTIPFPLGYQVVFGIGFVGAALSTLHLYFLMGIRGQYAVCPPAPRNNGNGTARQLFDLSLLYRRGLQSLRLDVLNGRFARIMGLLFIFHFTQFLVIPIVTPYIVNELRYSDQWIGLGTGTFNLAIFVGSMQLGRLVPKWGNKNLAGVGVMLMSTYPFFIAVAYTWPVFLLANLLGGLAWALAGGGLYNYIIDNVPTGDRPTYLAWYSLISNAAILGGSLAGPWLAPGMGIATALMLFAIGRLAAGFAIIKWG